MPVILLPDILLRTENNEASRDSEGDWFGQPAWWLLSCWWRRGVCGEGGWREGEGRVRPTRPCIHGVTAELSVQSEHIKDRSLRDTISSIPWCQRWRQIYPMLSGWHCLGCWPQQMAPNAPQPGRAGTTCDGIVFSLANRKKKKKPGWERREMKRIHKDIYIFTLSPSHFKFSFSRSVSGLAFPLLFVCLLVLNRLW